MATALYLRQSLDRHKNQVAIDRQRAECRALAKRKKWKNLREYVDNDRSASNPRKPRPEYQRLLKDMEDGIITAVVAWDLDRLHRRPIELERFIQIADTQQIALATVSGEVDLATPQGRMIAGIMANVARHEVEHAAARKVAAFKQMAEQGKPKWHQAFGYTDDHQPHPVEAKLVRKAYEAVLGGASLSGLAREWNSKGYYGRNGKPWRASTLSLFLRSPRNAGLRAHNNVIVGPGNWPALVDESTWRATQAVLDDPARKPGPKTVRKHFLTGVLRCGKCADGGRIGGYLGPRGQERYRCWKCLGVAISKPDADDLIRRVVCARLAEPDAKELLIDRDAPDLEALSAEANTIRARRDELADELADDKLSTAEWRAIRNRLTARLDAIEAKMTDASKARVFADIPLGSGRVYKAFARMDPDRQRAIVNVMLTATIKPVGKGYRPEQGRFDPERIVIEWRR
ncbi:MAG TPA: recombinase family protein [Mycobacterium sp.]|uniref:recombinase family protein n=1 Tax=Mycobacterium sp. TaxID=1785 RepID=UPI002D4568D1|nr:recombinase family protein [Mycobacterium sp.]HZU46178.1 recombinase family protein [Mycobacterium sp.]